MKNKVLSLFVIAALAALITHTAQAANTPPLAGTGSIGEDGENTAQPIPLDAQRKAAEKQDLSNINGEIEIYWHTTTNPNGPNYPTGRTNMIIGLSTGTTVGSGSSRFRPLLGGSVIHAGDLTITTYNLGGFQIEAGLVIRSQTKFRLADTSYQLSSSDISTGKTLGELGFSGNFAANNYSITRIGTDWVDGIKGNGNDIEYTLEGPNKLL